MTVTAADLLDALRDALAKPPAGDGLTGPEIARHLGCSERTMLKALHALRAEGRLETVTLSRQRLNGVVASVPGYRILPKAKAKR